MLVTAMEQSSALPDFNPSVSESRQGPGGHGRGVREARRVKRQWEALLGGHGQCLEAHRCGSILIH